MPPIDSMPVRWRARARRLAAFTLIEMLTVIAIIALIAAMVGPTLTHFRKGDAIASATRQLLDGVARARQLAIGEHTTVYMVFLPTNFWYLNGAGSPDKFIQNLTDGEKQAVSNLVDRQLTGYSFVSLHSVGDQPGQPTPRYLSDWQALPGGTFVPIWKFNVNSAVFRRITNPANNQTFDVYGFQTGVGIPFPSEDANYNKAPYAPLVVTNLPYVAFNYLGQLSTGDGQLMGRDEYIPLAHGSVVVTLDANKNPVLAALPVGPTVLESPPWNSTNSFYLVHIDRLTGRARLEHREVQ